MWKKKYFQEKKKTAPLEAHTEELKLDLDQINKKIIQIIDSETKHSAQVGYLTSAETAVRKFCEIYYNKIFFYLLRILFCKLYELNMRFKIFAIKLI